MQRKEYAKKRIIADASALRVGIVVSRFNEDITESMLGGARKTLAAWGVKEKNIHTLHVPGSFEIPFACRTLIRTKRVHAVVALGCVIKGETDHDKYIAHAAASGIMQVSLESGIPVSFGVITPNTLAQARARSRGEANKGVEAAIAALEMALL